MLPNLSQDQAAHSRNNYHLFPHEHKWRSSYYKRSTTGTETHYAMDVPTIETQHLQRSLQKTRGRYHQTQQAGLCVTPSLTSYCLFYQNSRLIFSSQLANRIKRRRLRIANALMKKDNKDKTCVRSHVSLWRASCLTWLTQKMNNYC